MEGIFIVGIIFACVFWAGIASCNQPSWHNSRSERFWSGLRTQGIAHSQWVGLVYSKKYIKDNGLDFNDYCKIIDPSDHWTQHWFRKVYAKKFKDGRYLVSRKHFSLGSVLEYRTHQEIIANPKILSLLE